MSRMVYTIQTQHHSGPVRPFYVAADSEGEALRTVLFLFARRTVEEIEPHHDRAKLGIHAWVDTEADVLEVIEPETKTVRCPLCECLSKAEGEGE